HVITAEYDPLRDEGEAYAERLKAAGVPLTFKRYDGMIHGFVRRTDLFDVARQAIREMAQEVKQVLNANG
ncbi:MAG: alpha/beta hydrolase fold domain-containing protein, partial [Planctomycetota bacterium]